MKPYSYNGGGYCNMDDVTKWAASSPAGPCRASKIGKAIRASRRTVTNRRARAAAKRDIRNGTV